MLPAQAHIRGCLSRTLQGSAQEFRFDDATGIVIGETHGIEGTTSITFRARRGTGHDSTHAPASAAIIQRERLLHLLALMTFIIFFQAYMVAPISNATNMEATITS